MASSPSAPPFCFRPFKQETGGILFREYCFGEEKSLSAAANSVSSAPLLGEFALEQSFSVATPADPCGEKKIANFGR